MSNFLIIKLIVQPCSVVKRVRISMQLDADEKLLRTRAWRECAFLVLASKSKSLQVHQIKRKLIICVRG